MPTPAHVHGPPTAGPLQTWPDLVLSMEQSGMILDSCTIQLLILSRRRRSTGGQRGGLGALGELAEAPQDHPAPPDAPPHRPTFVVLSPALLVPSCPRGFRLPDSGAQGGQSDQGQKTRWDSGVRNRTRCGRD